MWERKLPRLVDDKVSAFRAIYDQILADFWRDHGRKPTAALQAELFTQAVAKLRLWERFHYGNGLGI